MIKKYFPFLFCIAVLLSFVPVDSIAGQSKQTIDSLKIVLKNAKTDSVRCKLLLKLAFETQGTDTGQAQSYIKQSFFLSKKNKWRRGIVNAHLATANLYTFAGDNKRAIIYYNKALSILIKIKDKKGIANTLNNIAEIYLNQNDYHKAITFYLSAVKAENKISNNAKYKTNSFWKIAEVYEKLFDYSKAIEYNLKSLKFARLSQDSVLLVSTLNNVGDVYIAKENYQSALNYFMEALKLEQQIKNESEMAITYSGLTASYQHLNNYSLAIENGNIALKLAQQTHNLYLEAKVLNLLGNVYSEIPAKETKVMPVNTADRYGMALNYKFKSKAIQESQLRDNESLSNTLLEIGLIYYKSGNLNEAENYGNRSIKMADQINHFTNQSRGYKLLSDIYARKGNDSKAFEYYKKHTEIEDSIDVDEMKKEKIRRTIQVMLVKKETEENFRIDKRESMSYVVREKQSAIVIAIGIGLLLVYGFSIFWYYKRKLITTQNEYIQELENEIELRNKNAGQFN